SLEVQSLGKRRYVLQISQRDVGYGVVVWIAGGVEAARVREELERGVDTWGARVREKAQDPRFRGQPTSLHVRDARGGTVPHAARRVIENDEIDGGQPRQLSGARARLVGRGLGGLVCK